MLTLGTMFVLTACGGDKTDESAMAGDTSAATSATSGGALADTGAGAMGAGDTTGGAMGAMSDANILSMISMSNAAEIGTSKAAQNKLTDANVKAYARDMIREHQTMQGQADKVAKQANITPEPAPQGDAMKKMIDSATTALTSGTRGAEYDQQYITLQVQAHQSTLDNLQRFQNSAQNAELKTLIQQAIPKVQQHLQRARDIQGKLGAA
jgi:putative membrane protein